MATEISGQKNRDDQYIKMSIPAHVLLSFDSYTNLTRDIHLVAIQEDPNANI